MVIRNSILISTLFCLGISSFNLGAMEQGIWKGAQPAIPAVDLKEKGKAIDDSEVDEIENGIKKVSIQESSSSTSSSSLSSSTSSSGLKTATEKTVSKKIDLENQNDSDSEDESGYDYKGFESLEISKDQGKSCVAFFRGMHFSPSTITKEQRSQMRKQTKPGKAIYSLAAYDLAKVNPMATVVNDKLLEEKAIAVRTQITELRKRDLFQELYTNKFEKFNEHLAKNYSSTEFAEIFTDFLFKKNPQLSTSETSFHSLKYAFGKKPLGSDIKYLDPEYSDNGKPKHPYLGKVYIILFDISSIKELSPYFVVHAHANKKINVFNHFSNDILSEREVSIPGFIPGKYIVFERAVRVPSFAGYYKPYYQRKYGIGRGIFARRKKDLAGTSKTQAVEKIINKAIKHTAKLLKEHVQKECKKHNITICYKDLGDGYCDQLASIVAAKNKRANLN